MVVLMVIMFYPFQANRLFFVVFMKSRDSINPSDIHGPYLAIKRGKNISEMNQPSAKTFPAAAAERKPVRAGFRRAEEDCKFAFR